MRARLRARSTVLNGLNEPHGLAFYEGKLYVAENDKVRRYDWDEANLRASNPKTLTDLPTGGGHSTRSRFISQRQDVRFRGIKLQCLHRKGSPARDGDGIQSGWQRPEDFRQGPAQCRGAGGESEDGYASGSRSTDAIGWATICLPRRFTISAKMEATPAGRIVTATA